MNTKKKARGRPVGSEIDDSEVLAAVATWLAANVRMKPTTAMRRYKPDATGPEIRRWQDKWLKRKDAFMAEARAKRARDLQEEASRKAAAQIDLAMQRSCEGFTHSIVTGLPHLNDPTYKAALKMQEEMNRLDRAMGLTFGKASSVFAQAAGVKNEFRRLDALMNGSVVNPVPPHLRLLVHGIPRFSQR